MSQMREDPLNSTAQLNRAEKKCVVYFRWQPEHVAMKGMEHQLDFPDPASVLFLSASKSVKTIKQSIKQSNRKSPNLSARNPSVSLR